MCSEYKDARFPSLLMRKYKSSHEWFLYYVDVIKIWNIGLSLLLQVDLALFPAFLMGLRRNVKLHLLGWCCVCVCQCWPRASYVVEKGLGVAGFLGDLLGLSHCREVWSGFYFSPFFAYFPNTMLTDLLGGVEFFPGEDLKQPVCRAPLPPHHPVLRKGFSPWSRGLPISPPFFRDTGSILKIPKLARVAGWLRRSL